MNPARFPPLPPETRITVLRADLAPAPVLEVQIAAARPFAAAVAAYAGVAAFGGAVWGFAVYAAIENAAMGGTGVALLALGMSGVVALAAGFAGWLLIDSTSRLGLTAHAGGIVAERVWFGRVKSADLRFGGPDDPPGPPRIFDPQPEVNLEPTKPLCWRRDDRVRPFTPHLTGRDRAWLIAALYRVTAAAGRPDLCPMIPALTAVRVKSDEVPAHPGVRTLVDAPDRLTLSFAHPAAPPGGRTTAVVVGVVMGLFALLLFCGAGPDGTERGQVVGVLAGFLVLAGVAYAACAFLTVRATVKRGAGGELRVRRSVGFGPLRLGRTRRGSALRAVTLGLPTPGNSDGLADPPRCSVWLVRTDGPAWLEHLTNGPAYLLAPGDESDPAFAATIAARVAGKLASLGWRPAPPADWRFGWRGRGS